MKISHQNQSKPSISKEWRNKAKYLTWNFIRRDFVQKTRMPQHVKNLGQIKYYSSSSPWPVTSPSNSIRYNYQKICSWSRRRKIILEIRKKATFLWVINNPIIYKFFKDVTNHRKETNRAVVFNCRPFPNILKYRDHRWDLPTIWKARLLQALASMYESSGSQFLRTPTGIQSGPDVFDESRFVMTFLTILGVT